MVKIKWLLPNFYSDLTTNRFAFTRNSDDMRY